MIPRQAIVQRTIVHKTSSPTKTLIRAIQRVILVLESIAPNTAIHSSKAKWVVIAFQIMPRTFFRPSILHIPGSDVPTCAIVLSEAKRDATQVKDTSFKVGSSTTYLLNLRSFLSGPDETYFTGANLYSSRDLANTSEEVA
jgi:hypothetical protein